MAGTEGILWFLQTQRNPVPFGGGPNWRNMKKEPSISERNEKDSCSCRIPFGGVSDWRNGKRNVQPSCWCTSTKKTVRIFCQIVQNHWDQKVASVKTAQGLYRVEYWQYVTILCDDDITVTGYCISAISAILAFSCNMQYGAHNKSLKSWLKRLSDLDGDGFGLMALKIKFGGTLFWLKCNGWLPKLF